MIGRTLRHPVAEDAAFMFDDLEELIPGTAAGASLRAADER